MSKRVNRRSGGSVRALLACGVAGVAVAGVGGVATGQVGLDLGVKFADSTPVADVSIRYLPQVVLSLAPGTDVHALAARQGMVFERYFVGTTDVAVFARPDASLERTLSFSGGGVRAEAGVYADLAEGQALLAAVEADLAPLRADPAVRAAFRDGVTAYGRQFVVDDTYFAPSNTVFTNFRGQWHLSNSVTPGRDVNVVPAWNRDVTGAGVVAGVVDDSVDIFHPDLAPNVVASASYDFGQNDTNPTGVYSSDRHGTAVAGLVAARGGNGAGVSGSAPEAGLAGLRVDFVNQTAAAFANAVQYKSSGGDTSIKLKNHSYGYSAPYISDSTTSQEKAAVAASAAVGTIHLYAAGNDRGTTGQDANTKVQQSDPNVIAVAALNANGTFSSYSNFGANVFVTAPSNGVSGFGITTTDRVGSPGYSTTTGTTDSDSMPTLDYTSVFGGTSAATPIAAGVTALVKQVQPSLNVRFMKHLLARTSTVVNATDASATSGGGWRTNAAGYRFNPNFGFGLINADALVTSAPNWRLTPLSVVTGPTQTVAFAIPDNNATGVSASYVYPGTSTMNLEEVLITLNITHVYRGDIEGFVTSPSGTQGRIVYRSGDAGDNINWTYTMNNFWGENPVGTWTVNIRDVGASDTGTWNSFSMTFRQGTLLQAVVPEPTALGLLAPAGLLLSRRRR